MAASYWARWACNGQVSDLPDLVLPHVLAAGYDLLTLDEDRQTFDRGGRMKKINWSLSGGGWKNAPVDLTITYSCGPTQTIANFYWRLSVRPFPTTPKEQAGFQAFLERQMNDIIARLNEQMVPVEAKDDHEAAEEGATLQSCWDYGHDTPLESWSLPASGRLGTDGGTLLAASIVARRTQLRYSASRLDAALHCDLCGSPVVQIPGTSGRHYCLICRHHLPHQPVA